MRRWQAHHVADLGRALVERRQHLHLNDRESVSSEDVILHQRMRGLPPRKESRRVLEQAVPNHSCAQCTTGAQLSTAPCKDSQSSRPQPGVEPYLLSPGSLRSGRRTVWPPSRPVGPAVAAPRPAPRCTRRTGRSAAPPADNRTELSGGIQTTASGRQSTPSTGSVDGHNSHRSRPRWFVKAYRSRLGAEVAAPSVRHARLGRGWLLAAGASFEELVQAVGAASDGAVLVSRGREQRGRRGLAHQQQIDEKRLDSRAPTSSCVQYEVTSGPRMHSNGPAEENQRWLRSRCGRGQAR